MRDLLRRLFSFLRSASSSRTLSLLALLIVIAAVPLTVYIAQKQQEIRQHAAAACRPGHDAPPCPQYNELRLAITDQSFASDIYNTDGYTSPYTPLHIGQTVGITLTVGCGYTHQAYINYESPALYCKSFRPAAQECSGDNDIGNGDINYFREDCQVIGPAGNYSVQGHGVGALTGDVSLNYSVAPNPSNAPTLTIAPTPTSATTDAQLSLSLVLNGIGANGGTQNPLHQTRNATVCLYLPSDDPSGDANCDKAVLKKTGQVTFDSASGMFKNSVFDLGNGVNPGQYQILVKTDNFLRKRLPGIQTISATSSANQTPTITLLGGDADNNNSINILDYNALVSCFGNRAQTCSNKDASDIDDNGKIDGVDVNLFITSLSQKGGD